MPTLYVFIIYWGPRVISTDNPNTGLTIDDITIISILFSDDNKVIKRKTPNELHQNLDLLKSYCDTDRTKIVVFKKGGPVNVNEKLLYGVLNDFK